jgi:hypothetical protein
MGKLSGTVLILTGVSIAAYTLSAQQDAGGKAPSASAPPVSTVAESVAPTKPPARPGAGALAALAMQSAEGAASGAATPPPKAPTPPAASPPPAAFAPSPASSPQKLRPGAPAAVRVAEAPPRLPVGQTAATASPPLDRPALTREIQRHLKRIGCYQGDVSGVWSPSVRQAVKTVTDRVNASLPIDQPDPVLLAMVQSQEPGACAASCPKGQDRTADGRCLPAAIIAGAGKPRTPSAQAQVKTGRATRPPAATAAAPAAPAIAAEATAPSPALDGRMSLAGPNATSNAGANAALPRQGKTTPQRQRARVTPGSPKATAYYRPPSQQQRVRQRSAQRSGGTPFWAFPFFTP